MENDEQAHLFPPRGGPRLPDGFLEHSPLILLLVGHMGGFPDSFPLIFLWDLSTLFLPYNPHFLKECNIDLFCYRLKDGPAGWCCDL